MSSNSKDDDNKIMSAANVDKLLKIVKEKPFVTGGAFVKALQDLNKLRAVCENVVQYHNICEPLQEREAIGQLESMLL